ncbi:MAG TPA: polysaccharide deacetylase family protein [Polyangiaceae bacterium]|nr:polysaccharide deacetylase family protein [Polyangiaceae bacterium]
MTTVFAWGCSAAAGEPVAAGQHSQAGNSVPARPADESACPAHGALVSLTYDDGLPSQLAHAVPELDQRGLRATFFLNDVSATARQWSALLGQGHELGAHTLLHPCPRADWVPEGRASEDYDLVRMRDELDASVARLRELGASPPYSFAYPCGVTWVGSPATSYVPEVEARFAAARGVSSGLVRKLDSPFAVPAYFVNGNARVLERLVDQAIEQEAWIVFGFHGVGGDHLPIELDVHRALLDHLVQQREHAAVLPFGEAARCAKSRSAR